MITTSESISFGWNNSAPEQSHGYLVPAVTHLLADLDPSKTRLFDLGCGNGWVTQHLSSQAFDVVGVDAADDGIAQAKRNFPNLNVFVGSAYDNLASTYGTFDVVVSLEVVEHLYYPHCFARTAYNLLQPGGRLILSTPYHGWLKNVAIALAGKWDHHHHPLRDHGHIKFWSKSTLRQLLVAAGFEDIVFYSAGRLPYLEKSMICVGRRA